MSSIKNAPVVHNNGGFETRTATSKVLADRNAGQNTGGFELRASQEQGTH